MTVMSTAFSICVFSHQINILILCSSLTCNKQCNADLYNYIIYMYFIVVTRAIGVKI